MKKLLAMAIALLVIGVAAVSATSAIADDTAGLGAQMQVRAKIHTMGAMGAGLAISQANPMDFELLKIGIAGVDILISEEVENIKVGILYFGETRYKLKDIVIGNGTASATIYDANSTNVGSISLTSYPKGDREIWAGTLTLNGASYNAYIIQAPRVWKPVEKAEKVKDYCENNPEKCKAVMKAVGQIYCDPTTDGNCRDKLKSFCEQYPNDSRCKALKLAYCKLNLDDANCRADLINTCKENNTADACENLANMYQERWEKVNATMNKAPSWVKVVRDRIRDRLLNPPLTNDSGNDGPGAGGQ
jgi:hypothetical protein